MTISNLSKETIQNLKEIFLDILIIDYMSDEYRIDLNGDPSAFRKKN